LYIAVAGSGEKALSWIAISQISRRFKDEASEIGITKYRLYRSKTGTPMDFQVEVEDAVVRRT
jgi:hypothetical protein